MSDGEDTKPKPNLDELLLKYGIGDGTSMKRSSTTNEDSPDSPKMRKERPESGLSKSDTESEESDTDRRLRSRHESEGYGDSRDELEASPEPGPSTSELDDSIEHADNSDEDTTAKKDDVIETSDLVMTDYDRGETDDSYLNQSDDSQDSDEDRVSDSTSKFENKNENAHTEDSLDGKETEDTVSSKERLADLEEERDLSINVEKEAQENKSEELENQSKDEEGNETEDEDVLTDLKETPKKTKERASTSSLDSELDIVKNTNQLDVSIQKSKSKLAGSIRQRRKQRRPKSDFIGSAHTSTFEFSNIPTLSMRPDSPSLDISLEKEDNKESETSPKDAKDEINERGGEVSSSETVEETEPVKPKGLLAGAVALPGFNPGQILKPRKKPQKYESVESTEKQEEKTESEEEKEIKPAPAQIGVKLPGLGNSLTGLKPVKRPVPAPRQQPPPVAEKTPDWRNILRPKKDIPNKQEEDSEKESSSNKDLPVWAKTKRNTVIPLPKKDNNSDKETESKPLWERPARKVPRGEIEKQKQEKQPETPDWMKAVKDKKRRRDSKLNDLIEGQKVKEKERKEVQKSEVPWLQDTNRPSPLKASQHVITNNTNQSNKSSNGSIETNGSKNSEQDLIKEEKETSQASTSFTKTPANNKDILTTLNKSEQGSPPDENTPPTPKEIEPALKDKELTSVSSTKTFLPPIKRQSPKASVSSISSEDQESATEPSVPSWKKVIAERRSSKTSMTPALMAPSTPAVLGETPAWKKKLLDRKKQKNDNKDGDTSQQPEVFADEADSVPPWKKEVLEKKRRKSSTPGLPNPVLAVPETVEEPEWKKQAEMRRNARLKSSGLIKVGAFEEAV